MKLKLWHLAIASVVPFAVGWYGAERSGWFLDYLTGGTTGLLVMLAIILATLAVLEFLIGD